jgi:hypothetical protein
MVKQFVIAFAAAALSIASAETFRVTLVQPTVVKGTELKAGDYEFRVKDNSVVIAKGKQKLEVPVKVENSDQKFSGTKIVYSQEGGKYSIQEIRIGGSKTKLLFEGGAEAAGGGQ